VSLLSVEGLSVHLAGRSILHGITLSVPRGGVVAVLGRNGVGKTTLLRTIAGLYKPRAGTIIFDGTAIAGLPSHAIVARGIGNAPEGRQLFSDMTVVENLRAGALKLSEAAFAARLDEMVQLFPLIAERRRQLVGSLSGGEQQMVCIARALMLSPRLLLLDEPSLGLAPMVIAAVFELIAAVKARGIAVLLVEQNAGLALAQADHAYVLDQGCVVLEGPARALAEDSRVGEAYLGIERSGD
jgi:branched-chain amino acid transport system ATP-binding protein